jgi:transcriptional regulator with XRE-family HTH domain
MRTLGSRLKWAREQTSASQTALSRVADIALRLVALIEAGDRDNPELRTVQKLAKALDVPLAWLANGEGDRPDPEVIQAAIEPALAKLKGGKTKRKAA